MANGVLGKVSVDEIGNTLIFIVSSKCATTRYKAAAGTTAD
jgi:hypothetical protein